MPAVEEDQALRATTYTRPLNYTFDRSLRGGRGGFHYVFNEAGLSCSEPAEQYVDVCLVAPNEMNSVHRDRPSFVYLDCGAWVDNADGNGTRRRDFGLVCGPHVYLCEFVRNGNAPTSNVSSVQNLFNALEQQGCGMRVLKYNRAVNLAPQTPEDPTLYLFLPDFHMPPVTWFHRNTEVSAHLFFPQDYRELPEHLANLPAFRRQPNAFYRNIYSLAQHMRMHGASRVASGPVMGNPDIFRLAGQDLVTFLNALANVNAQLKRLLHVIHVGDMFELWLGRDYQFEPGDHDPGFCSGGVDRVADWALEVIIQNTPVYDAFRNLERAGLAETKYLWGNHDAYLKSQRVTSQLGLQPRDPTYSGLSGDLFAEHGHRFDRSNHDNVSRWSGPAGANAAFYVPVVRSAEPLARAITGIGHPEERDCYFLGATLIYLWQRYDRGVKPFSIYVMGHTHSRQLFTFNIRTEHHLYAIP